MSHCATKLQLCELVTVVRYEFTITRNKVVIVKKYVIVIYV